MEAGLLFRLLLVAVLVTANAFFVISEFALVRVRPTRLRELAAQGLGAAPVALRLVANLDRVLSGVQLGITMASLALGWVGENALAAVILPALTLLTGEPAVAISHTIALVLAFSAVTLLHVILGELVPKNMALARADSVSVLIARPMDVYLTVTYPVMRFMDEAAGYISRWMGAAPSPHSQVHSPEELKMLLAAGREVGLLPAAQEAMISRLFDLDSLLVREVMVPRLDMVVIPVTIAFDDLLRLVRETNYSRIPVYEDSLDKVIGVLSVKDLFRVWAAHRTAGVQVFPLRAMLRKPLIVPETKPLAELLEEFRRSHRQMAMVVDEFGRIVGLVTVEDVLEAVVGEIEDEFDVEDRPEMATADSTLELDGATSLLDLENLYGIGLPREQGFETLAGFTLWRLGRIPVAGERFGYQQRLFTVLEMDRRRIARMRVEKLPAA